jgi:hypothetical protein
MTTRREPRERPDRLANRNHTPPGNSTPDNRDHPVPLDNHPSIWATKGSSQSEVRTAVAHDRFRLCRSPVRICGCCFVAHGATSARLLLQELVGPEEKYREAETGPARRLGWYVNPQERECVWVGALAPADGGGGSPAAVVGLVRRL